ncbi:TonB-dependent receptor [Paucihalobacter ruber]|uniref:TonB-dependent receptor n=1 Tax=Paucihalobacter ruber TaxID=2567861 RepID=A0A506PPN6_9FLAO|nr:TonB-dependent receptor [Paucihalobacter ruber]TPV35539.1 TonB-dependent receptor [Paucihalobacter ruber]
MQKQLIIILILCVLSHLNVIAQERTKDTIDPQSVNVVRPYQPTISDAFKLKAVPVLDQDGNLKKQEVRYNIFSIPVASTFTPAKGRAAEVDRKKAEKLYDNYASLGVGSYTSILGEVFINHQLNNNEYVGGHLTHHSSQGGIDEVLLDDNFSRSGLSAYFQRMERDFDWKIEGFFKRNTFNWYGLPEGLLTNDDIAQINPKHVFNNVGIDGELNFNDAIINNAKVAFNRFTDDENSSENRFVASTNFDVPVGYDAINSTLKIDFLGGNFDNNYFGSGSLDYGNFNIGLKSAYQLEQDDLKVSIGANLVYLNDTEANKSKLFIYPNINATYNVVSDIVIAYADITGDLIQNTYADFATQNPFVSPTLNIVPTDQTYNFSLGMKGKLSSAISYNLGGSYKDEKFKPLFKSNPFLTGATTSYQNGNSFGIVYDDVKTISLLGELTFDFNRNISMILQGEYFNYNLTTQAEAWNLPDLKASAIINAQIDENWFAGASLFFVGERKDELEVLGTLLPVEPQSVTLGSFFDTNVHVGYKINSQLSVFGKVNNMLNNNYQNWANFPVQGIQVLAGATYQFDF